MHRFFILELTLVKVKVTKVEFSIHGTSIS